MCLADYQKVIVDQIYNLLINDDCNRGITLCGDAGSGKSTIALGVVAQLQEGWSVFYIEGINPGLSPYLTWHIGTKLHSNQKLNLGGEISFGISFLPVPISLEFGAGLERSKQSFVLTSNEESLLSGIKKQAGTNKNILFIADNYELWDVPSKQFLQKIMLPQIKLLPDYHLTTLLISRESESKVDGFLWDTIPVQEISDEDILFILRQYGYSRQMNIRDIRLCAGNDLSLALMAAGYYDGNDILPRDFNEILDKRYKNLPEEDQEVCKILGPLSIIDSCFTKDETAFFIDPSPQDETETEYQAEEYLDLAAEHKFITGEESYHFTSDKVKAYFKRQLSKKEKLYHRKFANYLQARHPEDYYSRGKHMEYSLQKNDSKAILETWQLLFLSYIRRASEVSCADDIYQIFPAIDSLLGRLPFSLAETQRHVLDDLYNGYKAFSKYEYDLALYHLQAITYSQLIPALLAEAQRLILLCYVQLADNFAIAKQRAEELYDTINDDTFCEDEQYCRAALVLLDFYIDRANDPQKVRLLRRKLIQIIQQHPGCLAFEEFEACDNRKASLYYSAVIASRQTTQSICFYRIHHNHSNLYMALCNHAGNALVCGDFEASRQALDECDAMLMNDDEIRYPSPYKVENNRILLNYLLSEKLADGNREKILESAHWAVSAFSKIVNRKEDEVSHVILFNYLGLSILCGTKNCSEELAKANIQFVEIDEYYQYFLHDLNFADFLLQGNIKAAQKELEILKRLDVPLLRNYQQIFLKRRAEQELLLNNPKYLNNDPMKYHEIIMKACSHIQDSSCKFFGRGFLLSDLQFLSF